jgi:hypothetical protein
MPLGEDRVRDSLPCIPDETPSSLSHVDNHMWSLDQGRPLVKARRSLSGWALPLSLNGYSRSY